MKPRNFKDIREMLDQEDVSFYQVISLMGLGYVLVFGGLL